MKKTAIIVAGGSGTRMGTEIPKQFLLLQQKPLLWHTVQAFLQAFDDLNIILVLPKQHLLTGEELIKQVNAYQKIRITTGGETRFHSVKNGLALVEEECVVFVHDGVRCLITPQLIQQCYFAALENGNAIPAVAATDSIRIVQQNGTNKMANRDTIQIIQTPQTFNSKLLKAAFNLPYENSFTDEASVAEKNGVKIHLVHGDYNNIKVTRPIDLLIAEKILAEKKHS